MNMTNKLILPVESRMQGDLHVRFGGRLWETYHRKVARRPSPSLHAKYAREPEMLNIEMKDFLENEDTSDFSHTRMNIYFRELGNESPLLVKLIMQSIYKNNDRKVRHLGSKRFGIQFLIKGIYTYNGMLYVHTQTKNSSNVPFDTDFIKFKIVDKKVPKRTAIQETVPDAVGRINYSKVYEDR